MTTSSIGLRRRLVAIIRRYPGLHLRELARHADMSEALAGYHLEYLQQQGIVASQQGGMYRRLFVAGEAEPPEADRDMVALLRQPVPFQFALILAEDHPLTQKALGSRTGLAKSTVSYHVSKLLGAGFLATDASGTIALREPARVERLLMAWQPPKSLADRFSLLWLHFYRRRR